MGAVNWTLVAERAGTPRETMLFWRDEHRLFSGLMQDQAKALARAQAIVRMRRDGMRFGEIRAALNIAESEPGMRLANESEMSATQALEEIATTIQRQRDIPRTAAILAAVEARPDLYARHRGEMQRLGNRMVRGEPADERTVQR